jgi:hypothetical protein
MSASGTDDNQQGEPPAKKPRIGGREIGAFLLLLAVNWTFVLLFSSAAAHQRVAIPYSPTPWWETLLAAFGPTILFFGLCYLVLRKSVSGSMFSFGAETLEEPEDTAAGLATAPHAAAPAEPETLVAS